MIRLKNYKITYYFFNKIIFLSFTRKMHDTVQVFCLILHSILGHFISSPHLFFKTQALHDFEKRFAYLIQLSREYAILIN